MPVKNLQEFIVYAKANQGKMQFGSGGAGSTTHMVCVLLNMALGLNTTHIPYRGTGPALQDLVGGRTDYQCEPLPTALPLIPTWSLAARACAAAVATGWRSVLVSEAWGLSNRIWA